jgi:hypothetical protein
LPDYYCNLAKTAAMETIIVKPAGKREADLLKNMFTKLQVNFEVIQKEEEEIPKMISTNVVRKNPRVLEEFIANKIKK